MEKNSNLYNPNDPVSKMKENLYHTDRFDRKIDDIEKSLGARIDSLGSRIDGIKWFFMATFVIIGVFGTYLAIIINQLKSIS